MHLFGRVGISSTYPWKWVSDFRLQHNMLQQLEHFSFQGQLGFTDRACNLWTPSCPAWSWVKKQCSNISDIFSPLWYQKIAISLPLRSKSHFGIRCVFLAPIAQPWWPLQDSFRGLLMKNTNMSSRHVLLRTTEYSVRFLRRKVCPRIGCSAGWLVW